MKNFAKLKIGRKILIGWGCSTDSTTQTMNFTRMNVRSKTMRILDAVIDHPEQFTQDGIIEHVYGFKRPSRSWGMGLFSALHHHGLITYVRNGHKFFCAPTKLGRQFYNSLVENA